ncbi:Serine palmitoyltransferase 2 [Dictyocoela muelleri]|nr:Serine palmitoyltransferase 2 [Dictyocoela muelleri]
MNNNTIPLFTMMTTYISFFLLIIFGHIRDFFGKIFFKESYSHMIRNGKQQPLFTDFESFFIRRLYSRIRDCWNRPIKGMPGTTIDVVVREGPELIATDKTLKALNLGSYNYLGFGCVDEKIIRKDIQALYNNPVCSTGTICDTGINKIVRVLEKEMAKFLYQEDCIVFPMGFGTNSCNIPILMNEETLIISDELNHTSIIFGIKMSMATVKTFAHNNMDDLEKVLRYNIAQGHPKTHKQWKKIFVLVEGLYSMEGTILDLKSLIYLKKKYKFYIFIDEAHSIGAIGRTGRGVVEYYDKDFSQIDIFMGTFTKSFGGFGGYIAGKRKVINFLRIYSDYSLYGEQISPVVAYHILQGLRFIQTPAGLKRIFSLQRNVKYFRKSLLDLGYVVFGDDSPIIPLIICNPGKIAPFSRMCLEKGLAVVVVGYPATPVISSRVRFCVSSNHTMEELKRAIKIIDEVGRYYGMNICK